MRARPARPPITAPAIWPPDAEERLDPESDSAVAGTDVTVWVTTEPPTVTTVTCVVGVEVLVEDEVDSSEEVDEDEVVAAALEEVDDSDEDVDVDDVEAFCRKIVNIKWHAIRGRCDCEGDKEDASYSRDVGNNHRCRLGHCLDNSCRVRIFRGCLSRARHGSGTLRQES